MRARGCWWWWWWFREATKGVARPDLGRDAGTEAAAGGDRGRGGAVARGAVVAAGEPGRAPRLHRVPRQGPATVYTCGPRIRAPPSSSRSLEGQMVGVLRAR